MDLRQPDFALLLSRLGGVRRGARGWLARCPAHDDRRASLSVAQGRDGRVLLQCFAGCAFADVVAALGLSPRDLAPRRDARRDDTRRRARAPSPAEIREALSREIARIEAEVAHEIGYVPPRTAATINAARARVSRIFGVTLPPVAPALWELHPHALDPWWPAIFALSFQRESRARFGPKAWGLEDYARAGMRPPPLTVIAAENAAARALHRIASQHRAHQEARNA